MFRLGGQDPLDYISMYSSPGDPELNIPPHWHYVSFGLSDLHGDGRVHATDDIENIEHRSGMGFELTFRLVKKASRKSSTESDMPPVWPANLLQMLARYVFQTGNRLCAGDNVPWRKSLDSKASKIQHMLIAEDPQLNRIETPFGWVDFCQIVGVTEEELEQATWWKGIGVLNLLKKDSQTGGEWLITDMDRSQSVFELFPKTLNELKHELEFDGSDLAGINADFTFREVQGTKVKNEVDVETLNAQILIDKLNENVDAAGFAPIKSETNDSRFFEAMSCSNSLDRSAITMRDELNPPKAVPLEGLELKIAPMFAKYLVLAIRDRIKHGRHFTFKSDYLAITFVAETVTGDGVVVTKQEPYAIFGYWMQVKRFTVKTKCPIPFICVLFRQILITDDLIQRMIDAFRDLADPLNKIEIPLNFDWPEKKLTIIIDNLVPEHPC